MFCVVTKLSCRHLKQLSVQQLEHQLQSRVYSSPMTLFPTFVVAFCYLGYLPPQ